VPAFVTYKKGCTRLAAASDKAYQLLAHGQWFSMGTSASSITKTGRHDIAKILLKVALNKINQINQIKYIVNHYCFTLYVQCISKYISSELILPDSSSILIAGKNYVNRTNQ
jgi:hypothetical protein